MSDLKHTEIGGQNIVLRVVPARDARKIQTMLLAMIAEPLAEALGQQSGGDVKTQGEQINDNDHNGRAHMILHELNILQR